VSIVFEYKVIRVPQKWWDYGPDEKNVEAVIRTHACDGWEVATAISLPVALGFMYAAMIVFRREKIG
jgi:hypothetical protein